MSHKDNSFECHTKLKYSKCSKRLIVYYNGMPSRMGHLRGTNTHEAITEKTKDCMKILNRNFLELVL